MAEPETMAGTLAAATCGVCGQPGLANVVHECKVNTVPSPTKVFENPIEARLQGQLDMLVQRVEILENIVNSTKRKPSAA